LFREYFWHLDSEYTYLDNAASTPPLKTVLESVQNFLLTYGSVHRGAGKHSEISTDRYESARKTIGKFINARQGRDVVIFTANTTDAINRTVLLYPWQKGDAVLISDIEHSSNLLPWLKMTKVITFNTNIDYQITPKIIDDQLYYHPEIRIVAIAGASNLTGQVIPIKDIYNICRKYNVHLLIDASQLAPHYPVSLDDCDLLAFSGHKMYAPFGIGVLAGRTEILMHTGLAPTGGGNVYYVHPVKGPAYKNTPWRHEIGTPNSLGAIAMAAAAETLQQHIGWNKIIDHNQNLTQYFIKHLTNIPGINLYFPIERLVKQGIPHTPIAVFDIQGIPSAVVGKILSQENIAVRCGTFCLYRLIERVKNISLEEREIIYREQIVNHYDLPDRYHLIRASGGLMTTEEDIVKLAKVLQFILNYS